MKKPAVPRTRKNLWIPTDVAKSLESVAKDSSVTQSEIVASALRLYLGNREGGEEEQEEQHVDAFLCDLANQLSSIARRCRSLPKQNGWGSPTATSPICSAA